MRFEIRGSVIDAHGLNRTLRLDGRSGYKQSRDTGRLPYVIGKKAQRSKIQIIAPMKANVERLSTVSTISPTSIDCSFHTLVAQCTNKANAQQNADKHKR